MKTKLYYVIQFDMSDMGGGFLECDGTKEVRVYSLTFKGEKMTLEMITSFGIDVSQVTEDEIKEWIRDEGQNPDDYELEQL